MAPRIKKKIPGIVRNFARYFSERGYSCFLVGGALRDIVRGANPVDYDFATDAAPEAVMRLFKRVIPTGIAHGTVTVMYVDKKYEVTTFRTETGYSDGRHPDRVIFTNDLYEDLARRDFTMNALAYDIVNDRLHDPFKGKADITQRNIRAIGNPEERFLEDGLRLLRCARFAVQLGFSVETLTRSAMFSCKQRIDTVSAERMREEIEKILSAEKPSQAFILLAETGILERIIPELEECRGVEQKGYHTFDVFDHSLSACDGAPRENSVLRLAALLHDIGKPRALFFDKDDFPCFHNHEKISADIARSVLLRLKFPRKVIEKVTHLIRHHMFNYSEEWTDSAIRRFIARVGADSLDDLYLLRKADQYGQSGAGRESENLERLYARIRSLTAVSPPLDLKSLAVNGNDLLATGIPPGEPVGAVLRHLLETVLEDPQQNKPEILLTIARNFHDKHITPLRGGEK